MATVAILDSDRNNFSWFSSTKVTLMLPTKFQVIWPFGSGEEVKNRFSRCPPQQRSWISYQNDFSYFCSISHPMLPTKLQVIWPFSSGEETKNRFSRCPPQRPSWISNWNNFSYFWSTSHHHASFQVIFDSGLEQFYLFRSTSYPDASYQVSSQLAQGCRRSRL